MPSGLTLTTGGILNWTPSAVGSYHFTVRATDAAALWCEQTFSLQVTGAGLVDAPAGLIAWWRAEPGTGSVAADAIGGHHGAFYDSQLPNNVAPPAYTPAGKVGNAFDLNGFVYVKVPESPSIRPAELTVEAWVYPTVQDNDYQTIVAQGWITNADETWYLGLFAGKPQFWSHGQILLEGPSVIPLDQWTHLAGSFDGTTKLLYVNGIQVAVQGGLGALVYDSTPAPVTIGSDWGFNASNSRFKGRLDEVSLYRRALSADEISGVYYAGTFGKRPFSSFEQWKFAQLGDAYAPDAGDPDGDGQSNYFEYVAGLVPTDPLSRFLLRIERVPGETDQKNLIFSPVFADRVYSVGTSNSLGPDSWVPLAGSTQSDDGDERTVTDNAATEPKKFYHVIVVKP
ncbi:MAG: putative Ig domain-containing protein [Opitutaceae bacterium]|nr:putative Ig domain-containing protein [Verrucomicrobiales bacterium]